MIGRRTTGSVAALAATMIAALGVHRRFRRGPRSFRSEYERLARSRLESPEARGPIDEDDLRPLPDPVARFLRAVGAVGAPRVTNFHATIHGRIRSGADTPWMAFTGEQFNAYGEIPARLFRISASMRGLPAEVFHSFVGADATMRVRALSMFPIIDARGPEMNRSETVTILNDMCVFAPAALVDADIAWEPIDDRTARAIFTRLGVTVSAELRFDERDLLVDFVSDDRSRSSADGSTFTPERWSTPLTWDASPGGWSRCTYGEGRWHPPDGEFAYLEIWLDAVAVNVTTV
jgi:Family of unknown function (DUF6544)